MSLPPDIQSLLSAYIQKSTLDVMNEGIGFLGSCVFARNRNMHQYLFQKVHTPSCQTTCAIVDITPNAKAIYWRLTLILLYDKINYITRKAAVGINRRQIYAVMPPNIQYNCSFYGRPM